MTTDTNDGGYRWYTNTGGNHAPARVAVWVFGPIREFCSKGQNSPDTGLIPEKDLVPINHAEARAILGDKWPATWPPGEGAVESTTSPATGNAVAGALSSAPSPDLEERTADASGVFDAIPDAAKSPYAPGGAKFGKVCDHGHLERSCDICERDEELAALRERVAVLDEIDAQPCVIPDVWANEGGVRVSIVRNATGGIAIHIITEEGTHTATVAAFRVARLCRPMVDVVRDKIKADAADGVQATGQQHPQPKGPK